MHYGGQNLGTLLQEGKLANFGDININFGVYFDSDRSNENEAIKKEKQQIIEAFQEYADFCWVSQKREIENYIPFNIFEQAVQKVHSYRNPQIENDDYGKRTKPIDLKAHSSPKANIHIPEYLFKEIKKNNGQIKSIPAKDLKKGIQEALDRSSNNYFSIDKMEVAKKIVELSPALEDEELLQKIEELVNKIKIANNMDDSILF